MIDYLIYYLLIVSFFVVSGILLSLLFGNNKTNIINKKNDFKNRKINLPMSFVNGKTGESKVMFELYKLPTKDYLVLNDCIFRINNNTTQIDHIVVSKYGIFVIETKHYNNCYLIGKNIDKKWTIIYGKQKFFPENPVRQNDIHVNYLKRLLNLNEDVFIPIVCICGANCNLNVEYNKTIKIIYLIDRILSFKEEILPNYKCIYDKLKHYNIYDSEIKKEHVSNIRNDKNTNKTNLKKCPWCINGYLVKRESEYGKLYGCSNYPNCEYIKPIK